MPQALDLVIKNAAGADKTFSLISPSAGDGGLATWALKEGTISSVFPRLTAMARPGTGTRVLTVKFRMPSSYTDTVTGLTNVGSGTLFSVQVVIPDNFPEALKNDFVAFSTNALKTTLLTAMIRDAVPAT